MTSKLVVFAILIALTIQNQYIPIPKRPVGIPFGNPNGKINIELVYDPVCYDTRDFDVNILRALQAQLSPQVLNQISFRMVGLAKPWHLTAHKIMQGINLVNDIKGPDTALKCFRYFLDNIPAWDNTILETKTINQFMQSLAEQFETLSGVSKSTVYPQLIHTSDYDAKARKQFKHSIGNRYVGLNPTIFVNDARVDNGLNLTLDQWKKLINQLLQ